MKASELLTLSPEPELPVSVFLQKPVKVRVIGGDGGPWESTMSKIILREATCPEVANENGIEEIGVIAGYGGINLACVDLA